MKAFSIKRVFLYLCLLVGYLMPGYFVHNYSNYSNYILYLCYIVALFLCIRLFKTERITNVLVAIILLTFWMIYDTYYHGGPILSVLKLAMSILYGFIVGYYMMKQDSDLFLKLLLMILLVYCTINTISVIQYPDGMYMTPYTHAYGFEYRNWFLGFKNTCSRYYLALIVISTVNYIHYKTKRHRIIMLYSIIISYISAQITKSSQFLAFTIAITILISLDLVFHIHIRKNCMKILSIIVVILFFTISVTQVLLNNEVITFFVEEVLGENMTFSGRSRFWIIAIDWIRESPIMGYGYQGAELYKFFNLTVNSNSAFSLYLQKTLEYGIIGIILLSYLFKCVVGRLDSLINSNTARVLSYGLFIYFIICIVENVENSIFWLYLGVCSSSIYLYKSSKTLYSGKHLA